MGLDITYYFLLKQALDHDEHFLFLHFSPITPICCMFFFHPLFMKVEFTATTAREWDENKGSFLRILLRYGRYKEEWGRDPREHKIVCLGHLFFLPKGHLRYQSTHSYSFRQGPTVLSSHHTILTAAKPFARSFSWICVYMRFGQLIKTSQGLR